MKHRLGALAIVVALGALMPRPTQAQSEPGIRPPRQKSPGFDLGQNYPNPFNPETRIPFRIGDAPVCSDPSRTYRVTLRIYNLLAQVVAVPVLQGGAGDVEGGRPVENVRLGCKDYTAYWNGKVLNTDREAASGIYLYRLEVDGKVAVKKMIVVK